MGVNKDRAIQTPSGMSYLNPFWGSLCGNMFKVECDNVVWKFKIFGTCTCLFTWPTLMHRDIVLQEENSFGLIKKYNKLDNLC